MKPIESTTGVERVTNTLLGTAAAAVATALTKKLLGKTAKKKRAKRKTAGANPAKTAASPTGEEVRHG